MSKRIAEKALILPALYLIKENRSMNTSQIIKALTDALTPTGEDAEILAGRKDTKFSQKVRNLMGSHYQSNGMSDLTIKHKNGEFSLSKAGEKLLKDNIKNTELLLLSDFNYEQKEAVAQAIQRTSKNKTDKVFIYDENEEITEGKVKTKPSKTKIRSKKLHDAAIKEYTSKDGSIKCAVCGFDFKNVYGELGEGFIEIHHEKPIYQMPSAGTTACIKDAIKYVKPLCSNCHRMIHRKKNVILTIQQLKDILDKNG